MIALFSLTYQGQPEVCGAIDPDELREAQREAFPRSPRRDAFSDPAYHCEKAAPLSTGRLLLSAVSNRSESDAHGRPVLRANACLIDREALGGPLRDLGAAWPALSEWSPADGIDGYLGRVGESSAWNSDSAAEVSRALFALEGGFLAGAAQALLGPRVDVWAPAGMDIAQALRPAFLLLPASRLLQLEFATGSIDGSGRERILGLVGQAEIHRPGRLQGLMGHKLAAIDCGERLAPKEGPVELAAALGDAPWPGLSVRERMRLLLGWVDSGAASSPFNYAPALDALRSAVRRVERIERGLAGWR